MEWGELVEWLFEQLLKVKIKILKLNILTTDLILRLAVP